MNVFTKPIASAWDLTIPVRGQMYLAIALSILNVLTNLISLIFIPLIVRDLAEPDRVWRWIIGKIAVAISLITRIWAFRVSHLAAFKLENILRTMLTEHLATVPLGYTQTLGAGAVKKIVQDDVHSLHSFVADSIPLIGRAYTTPIAILPILFVVDWRMALAAIATLPIGLGAMSLAMKDYAEKRKEYDRANENISSAVIEFVQGMQVVRTFDNGTSSFDRYRKSLDIFTKTVRDWTAATIFSGRIGSLLFESFPSLLVVLGVGIYFTIQGSLELPVFILFLLLAASLSSSLKLILMLSSLINEAQAGALRIGSILAEPALPQPINPQVPADASIAFKDVSFGYTAARQVLQNIDLHLPAGTVTALVGLSGAGKTTLVRLISRFWDVSSGSILLGRRSANEIGGVDIRQMTTETLMNWVSFVFQDPFLIHDTIRANICLGKLTATAAEIEAAAIAACAHDFILNLPDGYNTIAALTQNKTLIVIAHRLATIQTADLIVVLDSPLERLLLGQTLRYRQRGQIVEQGTHAELLALDGLYARLWITSQTARDWQLNARRRSLSSEESTNIIVAG